MRKAVSILTLIFGLVAEICAGSDLSSQLDAPLLFVKRHAYMSGHIYDDYYAWHPGGGIYVIEDPSAPQTHLRLRAVIDPQTKETLGVGVYRDPELSWDAKKILFAFKGEAEGGTSIYEIGVDGTGLRRLTFPERDCSKDMPVRALGRGRHDISPCYLPDGRIVFTSTRQGSRVPCFNSEVDNLHVMNADGSGIHAISVNNVNEFDPVVLPDGRILYGRWEYVDKTALYMQSLWTAFPDGTHEEAFFGNNLAKPTAFLDARPVPNSHLVVASLTPHNGQAVGAIAMIDWRLGKNELKALFNFTPEYPTEMDQGLMRGPCDPWPLSENAILISNNGGDRKHAVLEIISRDGRRKLIRAEPDIGCYSPMLVKPRPGPPILRDSAVPGEPASFLVQDIYRGLDAVTRGEIKWLRVIEETSRVSGIPGGGRWWNQAFLVSWQGSYTVKNSLGVVPVESDGSVHFEAPPGRALYFQALDRQGRLVQSMRTFVQAVPGTTRSCVGCHEYKEGAPTNVQPLAALRASSKLQAESWGSGFVDYATMIQPILDDHCVSCHGGENGMAGGVDLSGGWTWAFNISYETLLKNTQVGFLNCVNEAVTTSEILPPRTHGSGAAPLTRLLDSGHDGQIPNLTRKERDLLLAWMDGNCNYYGTWDWTETATCAAVLKAARQLSAAMQRANCTRCHSAIVGNDWINLQRPELSRILRAPLAKAKAGHGLGWCRNRKANQPLPLVKSADQPPDVFSPKRAPTRDSTGESISSFKSVSDLNYLAMLQIIRAARSEALSSPRVDMPGAEIIPGLVRQLVPLPLPEKSPTLHAVVEIDGVVTLSWERSAELIGLSFELHRGNRSMFVPNGSTRLAETPLFKFIDTTAPAGQQHYALVLVSDEKRGQPIRTSVKVPALTALTAPENFIAVSEPGAIRSSWKAPAESSARFNVYRRRVGKAVFERINREPLRSGDYTDDDTVSGLGFEYCVSAVNRRGVEGPRSAIASARALPEPREPVLVLSFASNAVAFVEGAVTNVRVNGKASFANGALELVDKSNATLPPHPAFDLRSRFSVECWVNLHSTEHMPLLLSYGQWQENGWFLQKLGTGWRWHLGGVDCDGGEAVEGKWTHLVGTFDGHTAKLFQDGKLVASVSGEPNRAPWSWHLYIGQYGASPGAEYQIFGQIAGVKIYHRVLSEKDVSGNFHAGRASREPKG